MRPRIAIVGAGISGLAAAWLLAPEHDVTLYEAEPRAGGHADTHDVAANGALIAVDTGFIVLNDRNYPHLTGLFSLLEVSTQPSEMSFGVSIGNGNFEYGGGSIRQLFAQPTNILRPRMWRMVRDILRFYREAPKLLNETSGETLGEFLDRNRYSTSFARDHILPMGGAIWSASLAATRDFPARSFARFFHNHGLLTLNDRPNWATVTGGSRVYVQRLLADLAKSARILLGCPVRRVCRDDSGIMLQLQDGQEHFDRIVLACHADQALTMLHAPSDAERQVLAAVRYSDNLAVLHSDRSFMPRRHAVWSAWNYLSDGAGGHAQPVSLTYWMNRLQRLPEKPELFVTLNPGRMPPAELVHATRHYRHPQFDTAAIAAQNLLPMVQGVDRVWFAGAWTGWGFHEDGIASAVRVAESMGVAVPW